MTSTTASGRSSPHLAAWTLSALILFTLALLVGVIDPIKYELIAAHARAVPLVDAAKEALVGHIVELTLGGIIATVMLVWLVRCEWRRGDLSRLLSDAPRGPFLLTGLVLLLWFSQAYLYPGHLLAGDTGSHMVRAIHAGRALSEGEVPFWNDYFYMGAPFLEFYAPLFYWLAGTFYAISGSVEWGPKAFLLICNLVSGIGMYGLVRRVGEGRFAALVAGLVYAGSWAHGHLLLYQGALPQAPVMALIPLLFWSGEALLQTRGAIGWRWAALAVVSGAIIATHQPHGVFAGVYLGLYLLLRWVFSGRDRRTLAGLISAGMLGVLMSLFAVVPHLLEQGYVVSEAGAQLPSLNVPSLDYLATLLVWGNAKSSSAPESAAYLGLSAVLLAVYAVVAWSRDTRERRARRLWLPLFGAGLLISLCLRGLLVRDVMFTLFFLAALAGAGAQALSGLRRHAPALILGVLMLDIGMTAIQPLARTDKQYLLDAGAYFAEHHPAERIARCNTRTGNPEGGRPIIGMGPSGGVDLYADVQDVGGPHNHAATLVHNFAATLLKDAESSLRRQKGLDAEANTALALLNVTLVSNDTGVKMGFPDDYIGLVDAGPLGRVLPVADPTPVLFSTAIRPMSIDPGLERPMLWYEDFVVDSPQVRALRSFVREVLAELRPDLRSRTAVVIPVRAPASASGVPLPTAFEDRPAVEVRDYRVDRTRVSMTLLAPDDGWVQLAHPFYPAMRVFHNGREVQPLRSALGLLVLPAVAGENLYRIEPFLTPLRVAMSWLSGGALLFTLCVAALASLRNRFSEKRPDL